jgi:cell wall-associated NlpC family hydrolase
MRLTGEGSGMGLAVYASRLFRSWVFNGIVLFSAATLLHPSTATAASTEAPKAKPAAKAKATKKTSAKRTSKARVAKSKAGAVPVAKAKVARSGGKAKAAAVRCAKTSGASSKRLASRGSRRVHSLARASRPPMYLPNMEEYEILSIAARHLGTPYRFGGATESGFDCSGFVRNVFSEVGMQLPHSAREQFNMGERVASDDLQPGDLVFFRTYRRDASHVGIYVGDSLFIHAASHGKDVRVDSLDEAYYKAHWLGARRLHGIDS